MSPCVYPSLSNLIVQVDKQKSPATTVISFLQVSVPLCGLFRSLASNENMHVRESLHALETLYDKFDSISLPKVMQEENFTHRRINKPRRLPLTLFPPPHNKFLHLRPRASHRRFLLFGAFRTNNQPINGRSPICMCTRCQDCRKERRGRWRRRRGKTGEAPDAVLFDAGCYASEEGGQEGGCDLRWDKVGGGKDGDTGPDEVVFDVGWD